ncbi:HAMP domain-containing protein [Candidatus Bipolaricaulota bacterium]|jgi:signal transduction histidine kinase|nr:HAMP domain-containing protein [Candidatus Bipolaricaulota bacterium]TFH11309.1 MAG: HAMP domain-containing protein [Candidatus Atribacteria bacterium]
MRRQIPLAAKLGVSFVAVIVLAVALIHLLTTWSTARQFDEYQRTQREGVATQMTAMLSNYREQNDTWVGVKEAVLVQYFIVTLGEQAFQLERPIWDVPYLLVEPHGLVIAGYVSMWPNDFVTRDEDGEHYLLAEDWEDQQVPVTVNRIRVDGEIVATLIVGEVETPGVSESTFLSTVTRSTLIGGGIAAGLALFLSTILIVQILRPLRALSSVTERVAEGDMPEQVTVRTHDELGRLGTSFNHMLESLKRSETARQTMTADIAHELRTPVTIIQGTLEAILDGIYDASEETIAPIYEETLHLGRLIDDLRDLALAEAGELRLEKEPVDLGELIRQVSETAFLARENAPNLHLDISKYLPVIDLDQKRTRQVIANLLSNAIRHTPSDGDVIIRARRIGEDIEMSVSDTGPGIKPEDLPHLFERFYRGDPARGRSAGSGLGLAIVKQWVEAHGGTIEAENRTTGGARFIIHLPSAS